jgi:hypothetical protein
VCTQFIMKLNGYHTYLSHVLIIWKLLLLKVKFSLCLIKHQFHSPSLYWLRYPNQNSCYN